MIPDPLRLAIALLPIAVYCLLIGVVNARRRPFLTTGGCDLAALGAALSGLVLIGPIELFRPEATRIEFGRYVWLFLLLFYWLWVWLAVLLTRPRMVVYNASIDELRPVLSEAARKVDPQARWAGDSLALPTLGVQAHLESFDLMRHVSIVSSGARQKLEGWRALSAEMHNQLDELPVRPNPRSLGLFLIATALVAVCMARLLASPQEVAQAMGEMFLF
ncbi:hypothetical protein [Adhaeretor mobilis]|uniref:Uncharacterized protein n=1 Tax=Adhaeretor mobilis TaxID=1930276 RepID=A0A517MRL0_9BACT|nr:hypothetical protein [Adhaeretor mobilis]QDS97516.1 hypothetical protein HG15A2_07790 [Adhaeretor mobilis]